MMPNGITTVRDDLTPAKVAGSQAWIWFIVVGRAKLPSALASVLRVAVRKGIAANFTSRVAVETKKTDSLTLLARQHPQALSPMLGSPSEPSEAENYVPRHGVIMSAMILAAI